MSCEGVIHAESQEETVGHLAAHAQNVRGLTEISDEVVAGCAQPCVTNSDIIETNPLS